MYTEKSGRQLVNTSSPACQLVVFSDDWGRHPSSCQHLIRELLWHNQLCCHSGCRGCRDYRVLWVNTVGTRMPELTRADLSRSVYKLWDWVSPGHTGHGMAPGASEDLKVIDPKMWPGFRRLWQRRLNVGLIGWHVEEALGRRSDEQRIAVTTLPITADLVGRVDVDRWVYYCVDDFSVWPGLDNHVMQTMERELVEKVDDVVVVSETLRERISGMGREASLLTHGIDINHWNASAATSKAPMGFPEVAGPVALFWGLIDRRLDTDWCRALAEALSRRGGALVLAGPQQSPDPAIERLPSTYLTGSVSYDDLPAWAAAADALVMPYSDEPVTRAMQPLKFKEYLATGKPAVVRSLPAAQSWCDAADVVGDRSAFVDRVISRIESGLPDNQAESRARLHEETWAKKAKQLVGVLTSQQDTKLRIAA